MFDKLLRYIHTLRYLEPVQIYGRLFSLIKKPFLKKPNYKVSNHAFTLIPKTEFLWHHPWNSKTDLLEGNFTFLNSTSSIGFPPEWNNLNSSLLWKFNLHYFSYLNLLDDKSAEVCMKDWIQKNPYGDGLGWHPYVLSLRICNWLKRNIQDLEINQSLYEQAYYLFRNLEFYHPANHFLENAKALIFTGHYFKGEGESDKWLKKGIRILDDQLPRQVFNDGSHFELSPMYHSLVLELLLDIFNILTNDSEISHRYSSNMSKMLAFLMDITFSNGQYALFNDSTTEIAPPTGSIVEYASRLGFYAGNRTSGLKYYSDSGYIISRTTDYELFIKTGKVGPDNIPAHAHADLLSYQLFFNEKNFIVDTGVFEYEQGIFRDISRSSSAHNTVTINRLNHVDCWGAFRVGNRSVTEVPSIKKEGQYISLELKYDTYHRLMGKNLIISRNFLLDESVIEVKDYISGSGNYLAESFIHLHPSCDVRIDKNVYFVTYENQSIKITVESGRSELEHGWYFPEFGKKIRNSVIVISSDEVPSLLSYRISK